jgi:uncharacterized metal-binding protein YceD (DUF177 family)
MAGPENQIEIAALHRGENRFHFAPDEASRRAIAERLGVPGVDKLEGDFTLRPFSGGVDLELRIVAQVNRVCVASLEPLTESVSERYAIRFERDFVETDAEADNSDDIAREPLEGDTLDLDELLIQHLAISLDPYPRKEGAESLVDGYRDPVNLSPFSGLKSLVDGDA